jgi:hypothetical protein
MTTQLRTAGDVEIQKVEISGSSGLYIDIRDHIVALNIYEDIFAPFITGTILIYDTVDFTNFFPLIGDEVLNLIVSTPGLTGDASSIDNTYKIYKMSDRQVISNGCVGYILYFTSMETVFDLNVKISKSYIGNIGTLATALLETYGIKNNDNPRYNVEPTSNSMSYISNFWSPVKNLNYLADNAINKMDSPTYLFFENRNGLNFISLESLYKTTSIRKFSKNNYVRTVLADGSSFRSIEQDFSKIIDIKIPVAYDYIHRLRNGTYASTLITYDITTKSYNYNEFNFLNNYDSETRLNNTPLLNPTVTHNPASAIITMHKANSILSGGNDISNSAIFQRRRSLLSLADSSKVNITVFGRVDYTVGQKVELDLTQNKAIAKQDTDIKDQVFSGFYIISSLRHIITRSSHSIQMELIKDSMILQPPKPIA